MSTRLRHLVAAWLPVAVWLAIIIVESTSMLSSSNTGGILYSVLKAILGPINHHTFDIVHAILRKVGHFTGYGILGLLFFRAIRLTYIQFGLPARGTTCQVLIRAASFAVLCTALVASADELHQSYLPSRTGAFHDVVLDTIGAVVLLMIVLQRYRRSLPPKPD